MFPWPFLFLTVALFTLGAALGSFLNVLIGRTLEDTGEKQPSWISGRSRCDHCHRVLAWYELIPLCSFLWLRGRCRSCHKPIALINPFVEFLTGTLFVWWYWGGTVFFKLTHQPLQFIQPAFWLCVGVLLLVIFVADLRYYIIPDEAVLLLTALTIMYRFVLLKTGAMQPIDFLWMVVGTFVAWGFFYGLWQGTRGRGMGFGDVKFMIPFGLLLGWPNVIVGIFIAFVSGSLVSVGLLLSKRATLKAVVPFGPFLVWATVVTLVYGDVFVQWYRTIL